MLVRRIARPLLAAPFIYGGISTLRKPQDRVPGAAPVVEKIAEAADAQLPMQVPRDVQQWVQADAAVKVAAGSLFALGKFPRLTALVLSASIVPTTLAGHRFWEHDDPTEQFGQISNFLKNTGLLGGLLLAAVDKRLLAPREGVLDDAQNDVVVQVGTSVGRPAARVLAHDSNDRVRDLCGWTLVRPRGLIRGVGVGHVASSSVKVMADRRTPQSTALATGAQAGRDDRQENSSLTAG